MFYEIKDKRRKKKDNQSKSHFPRKSGGEIGNYYDEDGRVKKKESDIWWVSGKTKRKQIDRSAVCEWTASSKGKIKDLQ
ncbi:hypothetical protein RO3G_08328 [Rhizopus delemar RA 99-880]|uniref:Uncharacterized protein n=1 Tax=Rhizopus delemar (strain RA 99-880 / ATCC MYA-4621 / FGSC 9543 / NRRL 43880) TaxID=246409 RepID=I1C593_RHIO9|nr:hypothetical protein RO3G_08328 [Rhizopus delemar RA 99-880]|eukprot:EIE83623.1 hypothetical protein RO3G_08328 [Rhizopus delemar RA 99-880]